MNNQEMFDWLNEETSGLLMWIFLMESAKELRSVSIEDLVTQMRDLNSRKAVLRERANQCKETVETKIEENEKRVYEVIRVLEGNVMEMQEAIFEKKEKPTAELEARCKEAIALAEALLEESSQDSLIL